MTVYNEIEHRSGKDRRRQDTPWYQQLFFVGQRTRVRRGEDRLRAVHLDRYGTLLFAVIMSIICLWLLDAFLTLILVTKYGAWEMNPLLAGYLTIGTKTFFLVKYMLTVLSIFLLLLYKEAIAERYRAGRFVFILVAVMFGSVVMWEAYLFIRYT